MFQLSNILNLKTEGPALFLGHNQDHTQMHVFYAGASNLE